MAFHIKKSVFLQPQKKGVSVAQQVEHIPFKDGVLGSSPSWNTKSNIISESFRLGYFFHYIRTEKNVPLPSLTM